MCLKKTYFLGPERVPHRRMALTFDGQIPRSSEDTSGSDTLTSAKVSHSTQLVLLGCLGCKRCWNRYQKLKGNNRSRR